MLHAKLTSQLNERLDSVCQTVYGYQPKYWGFGEAIAMDALLEAADVLGKSKFERKVADHFQTWWSSRQGKDLLLQDHVTPSHALCRLVRRNLLDREARDALAKLFLSHEGKKVPVHRPDLEPWKHHLWVDCLYTDGRFFAEMISEGDERFGGELERHFIGHIQSLYNPGHHLFSHGYETNVKEANGIFWGRGNAWALYGLIDTYELLYEGDRKELIKNTFRGAINKVIDCYDRTCKGWHTVLDHDETYIENSLPALFAGIIYKAYRLGLCTKVLVETAEESLNQVLNFFNENGELLGVSDATPVGDLNNYNNRQTGVYIWGQGALLRALIERKKIEA